MYMKITAVKVKLAFDKNQLLPQFMT